jgi:hypothetical protein
MFALAAHTIRYSLHCSGVRSQLSSVGLWRETPGLAQALEFSREARNASPSARLSDSATDTLANTTGDIFLCPAAETAAERAKETVV